MERGVDSVRFAGMPQTVHMEAWASRRTSARARQQAAFKYMPSARGAIVHSPLEEALEARARDRPPAPPLREAKTARRRISAIHRRYTRSEHIVQRSFWKLE